MSSFTEVPVLDYSLSLDPGTKPAFLQELKHALLEVGFLYIKNTGIDEALQEEVVRLAKKFFALPESEKLRIEMKNSPQFLGYSRLGNEITAHQTDYREQLDIATELPAPSPKEPRYRNLRGPNQWPDESLVPGFRETYTQFIAAMTALSTDFLSLVAEAIGLPKESFEKYFEGLGESESGLQRQDRVKIVKYPDLGELGAEGGQGGGYHMGPHKDSMLSSYLLQATDHHGLQVQNAKGEWVDCPQIPGTFVAMGQGLEAMTGGVCVATAHRVLSPTAGSGPRFSIPFFQGVSYDATFESMDVPVEVKALKKKLVSKDEVENTFKKESFQRLGEATLMNRIKSHPDVGAKYYPDLLALLRVQAAALAAGAKNAESLLVVPSPGNEASSNTPDDVSANPPRLRNRAPTIVVERISSDISYGEDPGPDGSIERKEAWKMRQADAVPDEVRVIDSDEEAAGGGEKVEVGLGMKRTLKGLSP